MVSLSRYWYDLVIRPRILLALMTCASSSTCFENFSSLYTRTPTPRSFNFSISYLTSITPLLFPMSHVSPSCRCNLGYFIPYGWPYTYSYTCLHYVECQVSAQSTKPSSSSCNFNTHSFLASEKLLCRLHKHKHKLLTTSGKSFMNTGTRSAGPRTLPWGTPLSQWLTSAQSAYKNRPHTLWPLTTKNSLIHANTCDLTTYHSNLSSSHWCGTESNAFK